MSKLISNNITSLFVVSATYRLSHYIYKYYIYTNIYIYLPHVQRICKEANKTFYVYDHDGSIHLHTDRVCDIFSSDYTTRAALIIVVINI